MYKDCSDTFREAVAASSRTFHARFSPTVGIYKPVTDGIFSVTLTGGSNAGDSLTLGSAVAATIDVEMAAPEYSLENREIEYSIGIDTGSGIEYVPMGYFRAERPSKKKGKISFTAYDRMIYLAENPYASSLEYPATDLQVLQEMCGLMGVGLELSQDNVLLRDENGIVLSDDTGRVLILDIGLLTLTEENGNRLTDESGNLLVLEYSITDSLKEHVIQEAPSGYSYREMISIIASRHGRFACFDRDGNLTLRWWSELENTVNFSRTAEPEPGELDFILGEIVCSVDEDTSLSAALGTGTGTVSFTDASMKQEALVAIMDEIGGFKYRSGTINMLLGDPCIDPWDMFPVEWEGESYRIPAMKLIHKFDGGLSSTIEAYSESESEQEYNYQGPTTKLVSQSVKESSEAADAVASSLAQETQRAAAAEQALSEGLSILQNDVQNNAKDISILQQDASNYALKKDIVISINTETGNVTLPEGVSMIYQDSQCVIQINTSLFTPVVAATQQICDSGTGTIEDDGTAVIDFYALTQGADCEYRVAVTQTSSGQIEYTEKQPGAFIVHGTTGTSFDWTLYLCLVGQEGENDGD